MSARILYGDAFKRLKEIPDNSVDSVVTDPPYGIRFMGRAWDGANIDKQIAARVSQKQPKAKGGGERERPRVAPSEAAGTYDLSPTAMRNFQKWTEGWATEAFRILKPGGHILCFASTRTYHRMACGIEDAGFEVRDLIAWLFGSGFPKGINIGKAIDALAGVEREVIGTRDVGPDIRGNKFNSPELERMVQDITVPATELAKLWDGWNTTLKPALEPVCVARKPIPGTVVKNVLQYGTGAINVNGCRIPAPGGVMKMDHFDTGSKTGYSGGLHGGKVEGLQYEGRWPANVVHDGSEEVMEEFAKYGEREAGAFPARKDGLKGDQRVFGTYNSLEQEKVTLDSGSIARFFNEAKPDETPTTDRVYGDYPQRIQVSHEDSGEGSPARFMYCAKASESDRGWDNEHETVKPTALMQWLQRLVTPKGGLTVDPFVGSGTSAVAALREGFQFIGIEEQLKHAEYSRQRVINDSPLFNVCTLEHPPEDESIA